MTGSPIGALYSDNSTAVTRAFGNGHSENDLRPEFRTFAEPMRWFGTTEDRVPDYVAAMRAKHGAGAEEIMIEGAPHVMIFPNLFIAEIQVFNIQPLSAHECVQYSTAVQLKGAPELNTRMVSQSIGSVGPAGMLLADDTEMYERNQVGVTMREPHWVDIRRGVDREQTDERGYQIGTATDETAMRAFWRHYKQIMQAPADVVADADADVVAVVGGGNKVSVAFEDRSQGTPDLTDIRQVEAFLYREARYADEHDFDSWEALWTDDALYWVPIDGTDKDPKTHMSVIYDNRNRISTRLKQLRTGKRYAQSPPSNMRRVVSNVELLGTEQAASGVENTVVGANFMLFSAKERGDRHLRGPGHLPTTRD